jgi:hypothetical protein
LNQNNAKYALPRKIWGKMPIFVQTYLGPHLIKGIL